MTDLEDSSVELETKAASSSEEEDADVTDSSEHSKGTSAGGSEADEWETSEEDVDHQASEEGGELFDFEALEGPGNLDDLKQSCRNFACRTTAGHITWHDIVIPPADVTPRTPP